MTTYENLWPEAVYQGSGSEVIMAGIASDVHHQHGHPSAFEELVVREIHPYILTVTVSINAHKRFERSYLLSSLEASAEISGMPYLVHRLKKFLELF